MAVDKETEEFLRKNMPALEELAPAEHKELMGVYEKIRGKYTARAAELLRERKLPLGGPQTTEVHPVAAAGIATVVLAAQVYDKATGGQKSKTAQKAG